MKLRTLAIRISARSKRQPFQADLFAQSGGARPGAGRKPALARRSVRHRPQRLNDPHSPCLSCCARALAGRAVSSYSDAASRVGPGVPRAAKVSRGPGLHSGGPATLDCRGGDQTGVVAWHAGAGHSNSARGQSARVPRRWANETCTSTGWDVGFAPSNLGFFSPSTGEESYQTAVGATPYCMLRELRRFCPTCSNGATCNAGGGCVSGSAPTIEFLSTPLP